MFTDEKLQDGPVPLWFQIAERLRRAIADGEFRVGDKLPSEADLNRVFGVSRTTARAALDQLEHEGLIARRSGKGSIVLPPRVDQPLNLLAGFGEDMRARGLNPNYRTRFVGHEAASSEVSAALEIDTGQPVVRINRLLCTDDQPVAFSTSWIAPNLTSDRRIPNVEELDRGSLYEWLKGVCGATIAGGYEFIEAANASSELAGPLEIQPGAAVLVARRVTRGLDGRPVEYAVLHYRPDRYRFRIELGRP
ncbi:transcriptional regulator, GntR family [Faunimonas pinastri]|uniref:Transcriptional regulator, GntR family n=1 Tax=Faunimonas pinastri TaxID=1855383 RepID=A0A1H9C5E5_9HYPH|nr:GntR family transcriptional regulator [Faunimonas pinastri]SEP95898.1 transcriptional regulator, GntR family [Faunimonas pinastri]